MTDSVGPPRPPARFIVWKKATNYSRGAYHQRPTALGFFYNVYWLLEDFLRNQGERSTALPLP